MNNLHAIGVIPARLKAARLPRKLLLADTGKPLLQHTWESASRAHSLKRLIVATDSQEIANIVRDFGGDCIMTGEFATGTDRVAAVVDKTGGEVDVVVNVQGDEPEIDPSHIDLAVDLLASDPWAKMATLAAPLDHPRQLADPDCVKVVCTGTGRALYFSRAAIPFQFPVEPKLHESVFLRHVGIYAFRRGFLQTWPDLPPSQLEKIERLEQLRALEAGVTIRIAVIQHSHSGIDTEDDYARFVSRKSQKRTPK